MLSCGISPGLQLHFPAMADGDRVETHPCVRARTNCLQMPEGGEEERRVGWKESQQGAELEGKN